MEHRAARRQDETADPEALRERLRYAKAADWPAEVLHETEGERIVLSRTGAGDRVPGIWLPGKGAAALIVDPAGSAAARNSPQARDLIRSGRPVLMIDAYQTGAAIAPGLPPAPGKTAIRITSRSFTARVTPPTVCRTFSPRWRSSTARARPRPR